MAVGPTDRRWKQRRRQRRQAGSGLGGRRSGLLGHRVILTAACCMAAMRVQANLSTPGKVGARRCCPAH